MKKKVKPHIRKLRSGKTIKVNSTDSNSNKNNKIEVKGNKNQRVVRYESVESPSKRFESRTRSFRNVVSPIASATDSTLRIYKTLNPVQTASRSGNTLDNVLKIKRVMGYSNQTYLSEFRKIRKDKGKQRLNRALGIAKDIAVGGTLLAVGAKGMSYLGKKGFYPKVVRDSVGKRVLASVIKGKRLPKLNSLLNNNVVDDIAKRSNSNIKNVMSVTAPAAALGGVTVGIDHITGNKHDLPITRKIRKAGFSYSDINYLSDFRAEAKQHTRKLKSGKVVTVNKGVKGKVLKPSRGELWTKLGLPNNEGKLTIKGHIGKGAVLGGLAGGVLSGVAASAVPPLILPAAGIGAIDGAIKGGLVGGGATYLVRNRLRNGASKK